MSDLPDLLSMERRRRPGGPAKGLAQVAKVDEMEVLQEPRKRGGRGGLFCFPGASLFTGCQLCAVDDDDFVNGKALVVEKIKWGERCGGKVEEYIEDVEEMEVTSNPDEDDDRRSQGPDDDDQWRDLGSPPQVVSGSPQDPQLKQELDALFWEARGLFASRKWTVAHMHGDRYRLNGRSIRLLLAPYCPEISYYAHLAKFLDLLAAERASRLRVCDGSLQQPLLDYLLQTGQNESYDERGTENIAIVTGDGRLLDFNIAPTEDRLLEMRSATIQADMRRNAGGEFARVSALQSEGVKLLGNKPQGLMKVASGIELSEPPLGGLRRCG